MVQAQEKTFYENQPINILEAFWRGYSAISTQS